MHWLEFAIIGFCLYTINKHFIYFWRFGNCWTRKQAKSQRSKIIYIFFFTNYCSRAAERTHKSRNMEKHGEKTNSTMDRLGSKNRIQNLDALMRRWFETPGDQVHRGGAAAQKQNTQKEITSYQKEKIKIKRIIKIYGYLGGDVQNIIPNNVFYALFWSAPTTTGLQFYFKWEKQITNHTQIQNVTLNI